MNNLKETINQDDMRQQARKVMDKLRKEYPSMTAEEMRTRLVKKGIPEEVAVAIADETIAQVLADQAHKPQAPWPMVIIVGVIIKIISLWFFWWIFKAVSHSNVVAGIIVGITAVALTIWDIRRGVYRLP